MGKDAAKAQRKVPMPRENVSKNILCYVKKLKRKEIRLSLKHQILSTKLSRS